MHTAVSEDGQQHIGMLLFRIVLRKPVSALPGPVALSDPRFRVVLQRRLPAQTVRGHSHRRQGMAHIEHGVAKSPFPVLPGFAPVDRREGQEQRSLRKVQSLPAFLFHPGEQLQSMALGRVVIHPRRAMQPRYRSGNQIAFRWMQIAAGGIHTQRPPGVAKLFCPDKARLSKKSWERLSIFRGEGRMISLCSTSQPRPPAQGEKIPAALD